MATKKKSTVFPNPFRMQEDPAPVGVKRISDGYDPVPVGVTRIPDGYDGVKRISDGYDPVPVGVKRISDGYEPAPVGVTRIPDEPAPVGVTRIPDAESPAPVGVTRVSNLSVNNRDRLTMPPGVDSTSAFKFANLPAGVPPAMSGGGTVNVAAAVKDKNGSAKETSTSGIGKGMGASNPTGDKKPAPSTQAPTSKSGYFGALPRTGQPSALPQGYIGVGHLDGSYTVISPDGTKRAFANEEQATANAQNADASPMFTVPKQGAELTAAQEDAAGMPVTKNASYYNTPATPVDEAAMTVPAQDPEGDLRRRTMSGNPAIDNMPADQRDRFYRTNSQLKPVDYEFTTEAGAPSGMGSIPTQKPAAKKRAFTPSPYRKR